MFQIIININYACIRFQKRLRLQWLTCNFLMNEIPEFVLKDLNKKIKAQIEPLLNTGNGFIRKRRTDAKNSCIEIPKK
jgi:hypothetical protein